jgi:tetratricopeptide (TPR) repeat protein
MMKTSKAWGWLSRRAISVFILILVSSALGALVAQDIRVSYVDGSVDVQKAGGWAGLGIGDTIAGDARVRLGAASYLELAADGATIKLNQMGSYTIADLLTAAKKIQDGRTQEILSSTLSRLARGTGTNQSAVMGVRGANEGKRDQSQWATSDAEVYLDDGKDFIASGEYGKAIERLQSALDDASDEIAPEIKYNLGYAYELNGDTKDSVKLISDLDPRAEEPWAPDFILLKAKLFLDTNAFAQDVQWLTGRGAVLAQDAQRGQLYYFLLALGYRGSGDTANEGLSLDKASSIEPSSDIGAAASELAKNP